MIKHIMPALMTFVRDEEGASLVEYILLVALIAVVSLAAVTLLGQKASEKFQTTANALK